MSNMAVNSVLAKMLIVWATCLIVIMHVDGEFERKTPPRHRSLLWPKTSDWGSWTLCDKLSGTRDRFRKCSSFNPNTCEKDTDNCDSTDRLNEKQMLMNEDVITTESMLSITHVSDATSSSINVKDIIHPNHGFTDNKNDEAETLSLTTTESFAEHVTSTEITDLETTNLQQSVEPNFVFVPEFDKIQRNEPDADINQNSHFSKSQLLNNKKSLKNLLGATTCHPRVEQPPPERNYLGQMVNYNGQRKTTATVNLITDNRLSGPKRLTTPFVPDTNIPIFNTLFLTPAQRSQPELSQIIPNTPPHLSYMPKSQKKESPKITATPQLQKSTTNDGNPEITEKFKMSNTKLPNSSSTPLPVVIQTTGSRVSANLNSVENYTETNDKPNGSPQNTGSIPSTERQPSTENFSSTESPTSEIITSDFSKSFYQLTTTPHIFSKFSSTNAVTKKVAKNSAFHSITTSSYSTPVPNTDKDTTSFAPTSGPQITNYQNTSIETDDTVTTVGGNFKTENPETNKTEIEKLTTSTSKNFKSAKSSQTSTTLITTTSKGQKNENSDNENEDEPVDKPKAMTLDPILTDKALQKKIIFEILS